MPARCAKTVNTNVQLQKEIDALKQALYAQNPSAASLVFMQRDMAAQTRVAEFHAYMRDNEQRRVQECGAKDSAQLARLQNSVTSLTQQNNYLLSSMNGIRRHLSAPQKVWLPECNASLYFFPDSCTPS